MSNHLHSYKVVVTIDNKSVEISEQGVVVNHPGGKEMQLASLFYRAMLACGISAHNTCEALGRIAESGGFGSVADITQGAFVFGDSTDGGEHAM